MFWELLSYQIFCEIYFSSNTANRKKTPPIPSVLGQHSNKQSSFFIGFLAIILCGFWGNNKSRQLLNRSILLTCHVFEKQKYPLTKPQFQLATVNLKPWWSGLVLGTPIIYVFISDFIKSSQLLNRNTFFSTPRQNVLRTRGLTLPA